MCLYFFYSQSNAKECQFSPKGYKINERGFFLHTILQNTNNL